MGFYLGTRRIPLGALEGVFTAREYCRVMETVERRFNDPGGVWQRECGPAFYCFRAGDFSGAVRLLGGLLSQRPEDRRICRLIGLAHLSQGRLRAAQRHLERARRLLKREGATSGSLQHALHFQLEDALLRYALFSLYVKLGRSQDAHALVDEQDQAF